MVNDMDDMDDRDEKDVRDQSKRQWTIENREDGMREHDKG
jgi:hypothetical protein